MKKPPIINRGYWVRVKRFLQTIEDFLEAHTENAQIISLGAGFDTTFWVLKEKYPQSSFKYIEVDFPEVTAKKIAIIQEHNALWTAGERTSTEIRGEKYCLLAQDLRSDLLGSLSSVTDSRWPSLFLAECVLVYMDPEDSDNVIRTISAQYPNSALISYDPIQPNDPMGRTMIENLALRGIELKGLSKYPSIDSHLARLRQCYDRAEGSNMLHIYNHSVDVSEKARIERIEWMDEFEEWNMLLSHYCILLCCKGAVDLTLTLN